MIFELILFVVVLLALFVPYYLERSQKNKEFFEKFVSGVLSILIGIGLTVWSYHSAKPGEIYVIFIPFILGGIYLILDSLKNN